MHVPNEHLLALLQELFKDAQFRRLQADGANTLEVQLPNLVVAALVIGDSNAMDSWIDYLCVGAPPGYRETLRRQMMAELFRRTSD